MDIFNVKVLFFNPGLFPNTEDVGVNFHATKLTKKEAETISKDEKLKEKVLKSYILMLDFWGMELNEKTGEVSRGEHYKQRYKEWSGGHNNLRITRCLKSLLELGLGKYQKPFAQFLTKEVLCGEIKGCSGSLTDFWITTLPKGEQKEILDIFNEYRPSKKSKKWVHSKDCIEKASETKVEMEEKKLEEDETNEKFPETPIEVKNVDFDEISFNKKKKKKSSIKKEKKKRKF